MIPKATLRKRAPDFITAREIIRRHLHEAGHPLTFLADAWSCQEFSVYRVFQRTERHLQPHHVEGAIRALQLDDFDANELRLAAAREAGFKINPQFLLQACCEGSP